MFVDSFLWSHYTYEVFILVHFPSSVGAFSTAPALLRVGRIAEITSRKCSWIGLICVSTCYVRYSTQFSIRPRPRLDNVKAPIRRAGLREKGTITNPPAASAPQTAAWIYQYIPQLGYWCFTAQHRLELYQTSLRWRINESGRLDRHVQVNDPSAPALSLTLGWRGGGSRLTTEMDPPSHQLLPVLIIMSLKQLTEARRKKGVDVNVPSIL